MEPSTTEPAAFELDGVCPLLQVFDMPAALNFYRDVLGFRVIHCAPPGAPEDRLGWAWLQHGAAELMLNTVYDPDSLRPSQPDARRVAAHADTVLFIGCPDVDAVYRRLRAHGLNVKPPTTTHYGMTQLYVKDPDGFDVCFQRRAGEARSSAPATSTSE